VIPQAALHVISIRAPKELMPTIEDAIKSLDVPVIGPRSVELTIHVLVASDQDETLRPVPALLKPVVDQLKGVLSYKQFYLLDTLLGNTVESTRMNLRGDVRGLAPPTANSNRDTGYQFSADIRLGSGDSAAAVIRLASMNYLLNTGVSIVTEVDIPQGKQIVVGKGTGGDRAFILVVSAKVLN